jgi:uncharacterized membrane protein
MSSSRLALLASDTGSDFENWVSDVVKVIEVAGMAIMVLGGGAALAIGLVEAVRRATRNEAYERTRRNLGRAILLGLEVLIIADIVRTIVVEPTLESVLVLGAIVVIRIILSFSLEVEMTGTWPWSMWRVKQDQRRERAPDRE